MSSVAITPERPNYLNQEYGVRSWLLTTDHKRIGLLYLMSITFFFFIGGFFALLIRLELLTPAGDLVLADTYNKLFTMHGQVMVFFFLVPSIPAVLGNFLVPIMIGAKDLAFPRINLLSWYVYMVGRAHHVALHSDRRGRHRLDLLHPVQYRFQSCLGDRSWRIYFHRWILLNPYRAEHCGHGASHARSRYDLVAPAAVRLVAICHQHHHVAGNACPRHHFTVGCL